MDLEARHETLKASYEGFVEDTYRSITDLSSRMEAFQERQRENDERVVQLLTEGTADGALYEGSRASVRAEDEELEPQPHEASSCSNTVVNPMPAAGVAASAAPAAAAAMPQVTALTQQIAELQRQLQQLVSPSSAVRQPTAASPAAQKTAGIQ